MKSLTISCWQAATDVVAFIALNGTGAPHWESPLSSSLHGLAAASTSADVVRGIVENIAFFMKDIADVMKDAGVESAAFSVSGGLSSLTYLVQFQADILEKELRVSTQQEVSALGAALLAGLANGTWTFADIKKLTNGAAKQFSPQKQRGGKTLSTVEGTASDNRVNRSYYSERRSMKRPLSFSALPRERDFFSFTGLLFSYL